MRVPVVTDANGQNHELHNLVNKFAKDHKDFIRRLLLDLAVPSKYAKAAESLIFLNAFLYAEHRSHFNPLASLTQISKQTEAAMRKTRNNYRREIFNNANQISEKATAKILGLELPPDKRGRK